MFGIDTYTLVPLSSALTVITGSLVLTFILIRKVRKFMNEDAEKAIDNE